MSRTEDDDAPAEPTMALAAITAASATNFRGVHQARSADLRDPPDLRSHTSFRLAPQVEMGGADLERSCKQALVGLPDLPDLLAEGSGRPNC
jgi:hypothetical protein